MQWGNYPMMGFIKAGRIVGCGVATIAALALFSGSAQAVTLSSSCSSTGLLTPILGNPTCTTAPMFIDLTTVEGHSYVYTAQGRARSLLLPAGVKVDFIVNGVVTGELTRCETSASQCYAVFTKSEAIVPPGWLNVQARCTWTNRLAVLSAADCKQTLVTTPPPVAA